MIYDKLNGQTLAYVGDAYWSLLVRKYLIDKGITKAIDLQKNSIKFVSAKAQANFYEIIKEELNDAEKDIFKRGRNYKTNSSPKNTDIMTYHISTGFEALIGYWYLNEEWERIELMWNIIKTKMEEANGTISIREECC